MAQPSADVLVIEDNEDIRTVLVEILELEGYRAVGASNGADALKLLRTSTPLPRLILLDMSMPIMSGEEFRELQLQDPLLSAIPLALLTASEVDERATRLGAAGWLRKPFATRELVTLAKGLLREPACHLPGS